MWSLRRATAVIPLALLLASCQSMRAPRTAETQAAAALAARQWKPISVAPGVDAYVVELDDTGFVDLRHLNFRNPPTITDDAGITERLQFDNRTVDRRISVSVPIIAIADKAAVEEGGFVATCDPPPCSAKATIKAGAHAFIRADFLPVNAVVPFRTRFVEELETPTNSLGYVRWNPAAGAAVAPPNQYTITGGINGLVEPKLALSNPADITKPLTLSPTSPFVGGERRFFRGTANFDGTMFVPQWGSGEATITLKDGEYGRDPTLSVAASKYRINLVSINGLALRFGKFLFAAPSNKVAINELGEGFQFDLSPLVQFEGALNASVIVKRQRHPDATAAPLRDDSALLVQFTGIPFQRTPDRKRRSAFFRTASFYALFGRDENTADEHSYATVGSEIAFALPQTARHGYLSGATALYVSRRGQGKFDDSARGGVSFTRIAYTPIVSSDPKAPSDTFTALLGIGSADDAATSRDEGYISENQAFAPDIIFFALLTRPLRVGDTPGIGFGLGNKLYIGAQYSTNRWSLLHEVAKLLLDPKEIASWSSTLSLHKYDLREHRATHRGTDAGWEVDLRFTVETLPKVKVNLGVGYYRPGEALADIVQKDVWAVTSGVVIEP
jgi:hypothetical protein